MVIMNENLKEARRRIAKTIKDEAKVQWRPRRDSAEDNQ